MSKTDTIPIRQEKYCEKCPHRELEIIEESLYADGIKHITEAIAVCKHSGLCNHLWNHLLDYTEEHDLDDDDELPPDDNNDWSFTADASWEDRQI